MKKIIDGRLYDTANAEKICDISGVGGTMGHGDFKWENTQLYRTKNGRFFIAGEGGAMSRWRHAVGNGMTGGEGLKAVEEAEARRLCEAHGTAAQWVATFGDAEEG